MAGEAVSKAEWVEHQGVRIIKISVHNMEAEQYAKELRAMAPRILEMIKAAGEKRVIALTDLQNNEVSTDVLKAYRELVKLIKKYVKANAVCGLTGLRKRMMTFLVAGSGMQAQSFESEAEAKEWLLNL